MNYDQSIYLFEINPRKMLTSEVKGILSSFLFFLILMLDELLSWLLRFDSVNFLDLLNY